MAKKPVTNYFYQFDIIKEGETPNKLLNKIYNNITLNKCRIKNDNIKDQILTCIGIINKIDDKDGQYGILFIKGPYGFNTTFIDKEIDLNKIDIKKDSFGRESGKAITELEETHFYSTLKININETNDGITGIISIPRLREGITVDDIDKILKSLFKEIFTEQGYYRPLRMVYNEASVIQIANSITKVEFIKDLSIKDMGFEDKELFKEVGFSKNEFKIVSTGEHARDFINNIFNYIKNSGGKQNDEDFKNKTKPLRHLKIYGKNGLINMDNDNIKLKNIINVEGYITKLDIEGKKQFYIDNLKFINKYFSNYFIK